MSYALFCNLLYPVWMVIISKSCIPSFLMTTEYITVWMFLFILLFPYFWSLSSLRFHFRLWGKEMKLQKEGTSRWRCPVVNFLAHVIAQRRGLHLVLCLHSYSFHSLSEAPPSSSKGPITHLLFSGMSFSITRDHLASLNYSSFIAQTFTKYLLYISTLPDPHFIQSLKCLRSCSH